jgi:3-methyladenine DNA glycosylase AlkD
MDQDANMELIAAVRADLARLGDPARAAAMQAYMKSATPFRGVRAPEQARAFRAVFAAHPLSGADAWRATALALWRGASFREERYAALALLGDHRYRGYRTLDMLPVYEELIVTGAWWDLVDGVAIHRLGELFARDPERMRAAMLAWSQDGDLWKRRAAILSQCGRKAATDEALLYGCIAPNLADRDFFIRKAIGWALREYAYSNPAAARRYVNGNADALSPLSQREALKHVGTLDNAPVDDL